MNSWVINVVGVAVVYVWNLARNTISMSQCFGNSDVRIKSGKALQIESFRSNE